MFRLKESALPPDFHFPQDLEKLGYYINEHDQVRSIKHPDEEFNFFISKNERMKIMQREAHNACIRTNISSRLLSPPLSLTLTRLPLGTSAQDPHIPIYTSSNISTCSRLILYIGETWQDLGILAWRAIGQDSIASGSIIDLVAHIQSQSSSDNDTGIMIANPGQLLWCRNQSRAVTMTTWQALPRKTAVGQAMEITERNRVPGHRDPREQTASLFEEVIPQLCRGDVKIDVAAIGDGATEAVEYLRDHWEGGCERNVVAVALGVGYLWSAEYTVGEGVFRMFWGDRARAYIQSNEPLDTPLAGRKEMGCNCFSAGESGVVELIMPTAYKSMLQFFQLVDNVKGYCEVPAEIDEENAAAIQEAEEAVELQDAEDVVEGQKEVEKGQGAGKEN